MSVDTLNSLSNASSSYLRSAMHQPIRWHEWGEEAFEEAKRENKPILLDIGAVWCHWCHVMDRESYDDPEIAQIVNERFVAIKVDRDERPDIDTRYQVAVQAVSGQGGWPLTAFLTPDGKPFYGGTYFPPMDHYGRPSFRRVLVSISDAYREKNGDVVEQAKLVEGALAHSESFAGKTGDFSPPVIQEIVDSALKMFDEAQGGFGSAPKFPHASMIDLMIDQYQRGASLRWTGVDARPYTDNVRTGEDARRSTGDAEKLRHVFTTTLEKMARGGVYDQLAGGFHRYSVDERWIVPHFEKMSYDNSELLKNYVHAYQATGSEFFAEVARDIIRWMDDWVSDRERGGFYASQDADISMDDDGDYFTWTVEEARTVLSEDELKVAALRYDINEVGEMHHNPAKNVLYVRAPIEEIGRRLNVGPERVSELLESAKKKMYAARLKRPTPYVDKTVYVGWNSMCIAAYLETARVLNLDEARRFALRSLDRILSKAWRPEPGSADGGRAAQLLHVVAYSDPKAEHREVSGLLDDYAATALACLDAYEATADISYFRFAHAIADAMIAKFFDLTSGGFFDTEPLADDKTFGVLSTRRKPLQDSPTPAGNPMAAIALLRLHGYTGDAAYRDRAEQTLETFAGVAEQFGIFAGTYGIAVAHLFQPHLQVIVIAGDNADRRAAELYSAAAASFAFGKSVIRLAANQAVANNLPPALAATIPNLPDLTSGKSFAVVCSGFSCQPPVSDPGKLQEVLAAAA